MISDSSIDEDSSLVRLSPSRWWGLLCLFVLAALTVLLLTHVNRYATVDAQLIKDPEFVKPLGNWLQRGSEQAAFGDGRLVIINDEGASHSVLQRILIQSPAFIRFQFDARAIEVTPGIEPWARAAGAIIHYNKDGERISSAMIGELVGTTDFQKYVHTEKLNSHIGSVDVAFRLLKSGGRFEVTNPEFQLIEETVFFKIIKATIALCWVVLFIIFVAFLLKIFSFPLVLTGMFLFGFIIFGILVPEHLITAVNQRVAAMLPISYLTDLRGVLSNVYGISQLSGAGAEISKVGHLMGFVPIGLLAGLMSIRLGVLFTSIGLFGIAMATEALQIFTETRTASVNDLLLDMSGGMLGFFIGAVLAWGFVLVQLLKKKLLFKQENTNSGKLQ